MENGLGAQYCNSISVFIYLFRMRDGRVMLLVRVVVGVIVGAI